MKQTNLQIGHSSVVYFDQHLGAVHTKQWSKSAFSILFARSCNLQDFDACVSMVPGGDESIGCDPILDLRSLYMSPPCHFSFKV